MCDGTINSNMIGILVPYKLPMWSWLEIGASNIASCLSAPWNLARAEGANEHNNQPLVTYDPIEFEE